jgi:hypothetical protein
MAHREFRDDEGRMWTVWEVRPERRDRREGGDRRQQPRRSPDRRKRRLLLAVVGPELARGWLAFEAEGVRRRYTPVPEGWSEASEADLRSWWRAAQPLPPAISRKRRLFD